MISLRAPRYLETSARLAVLFAVLALMSVATGSLHAQCILANPSFEVSGSGGQIIGGWNHFGDVGTVAEGVHGHVAARVTGPDLDGWDVSGYWQPFDCSPGESWLASVSAMHPSSAPLTGQSRAMLNIEWRDAAGDLISYESHAPVDASSPADEYVRFTVDSAPAPTGTATVHLLLGVLQEPGAPRPVVCFDHAEFHSASSPDMDEQQWADFPGGTTVQFSGRTWRVKGPGYYGPGPNLFADAADHVWVDVEDQLHLTIRREGTTWFSTEVVLEEALGYGDYVFTTRGRLDQLDEHAVLGLFLWQYGPCWDQSYLWWNPYNEIDVEFSRWGTPGHAVAQFVAQPYDWPGNLSRFDPAFAADEVTSHAFHWLPDRVEYRSWRGGPDAESTSTPIHTWTYAGPHIPRPEQPRVHINLWQFDGPPAAEQEVVLPAFTFVPTSGATGVVDDGASIGRPIPPVMLRSVAPNPCNPRTTVTFVLEQAGHVDLALYDVAGRLVRTLLGGHHEAGEHRVVWDGRDDQGRAVSSGTYLCRVRAGGSMESRGLVLAR